MLQTGTEVSWKGVRLCGCKVHVISTPWRIKSEPRVHCLHFTGVRIHTSSRLATLDIAPNHGCHVSFVIHEASIKVGAFVWISRSNVSRATAEGVLQEICSALAQVQWKVYQALHLRNMVKNFPGGLNNVSKPERCC